MRTFLAAVAGMTGAAWYKCHSEAPAMAYPWLAKSNTGPAFSHAEFHSYKLAAVSQETHDTKRFRFDLPSSNTSLQLPVPSCIVLRYMEKDGTEVERPYTPLNMADDKGHFDLLVKCYPNSKMGTHLFSLKVGDTIEAKGAYPTYSLAPSQFAQVGMIAGGTGITPMYQIMNNFLNQKSNTTKFSLLFANKSEEDMLITKELNDLLKRHSDKLTVHHCLEKPSSKWTGYSGFINKAIIKDTMPGSERKNEIRILVSGPPAFMQAICGAKDFSSMPPKQGKLAGYLKELGYDETCVYKF